MVTSSMATAVVNVTSLRLSQVTCKLHFRCGRSIFELLDDLITGATMVESFTLDVVSIGDCFWLLDHRRAVIFMLYSYMRGELLVRCRVRELNWWDEKLEQPRIGADGRSIILKASRRHSNVGYLFTTTCAVTMDWWCQYYMSRDWSRTRRC